MDKKTTGIIATAATALVCGCPGLGAICFGGSSALAGVIPGSEIDIFGSHDPGTALAVGFAALCIGVIGVVAPVAVGFFTLRKTDEEEEAVESIPQAPSDAPVSQPVESAPADSDDDIPPAS